MTLTCSSRTPNGLDRTKAAFEAAPMDPALEKAVDAGQAVVRVWYNFELMGAFGGADQVVTMEIVIRGDQTGGTGPALLGGVQLKHGTQFEQQGPSAYIDVPLPPGSRASTISGELEGTSSVACDSVGVDTKSFLEFIEAEIVVP